MNANFSCLALFSKDTSPELTAKVAALAGYLYQRGHKVLLELALGECLPPSEQYDTASDAEIGRQCQLAIVLGGDGTLLACARRMVHFNIPLIGINLGRLGFLTDINRGADADARLQDVLDGKFTEESRVMLQARVERQGVQMAIKLALNDIVLAKGGELGRMIEFDVFIDKQFVYTQRSDGIVIATPTGSTAYSLSANGPILHPAVSGFAITPLSPHALTARPITVPDNCTVRIVLKTPFEAYVYADGQSRLALQAKDVVEVYKAEQHLRLLHPLEYSYFSMLRNKLDWSSAPRDNLHQDQASG